MEPQISIQGFLLTAAQAMTIRVAIENFAVSLRDGLGDDAHGKAMTEGYLARIQEIRKLMRL